VADQPQNRRTALVTGFTGQDGSFLAELLLGKGYDVTGLVRTGDDERLGFSEHLRGQVTICDGDLLEPDSLTAVVDQVRPDELYHLAAPSFTPASWDRPGLTLTAIAGATASLLEAVRGRSPDTRVFVAASGAMFGATLESPQREETPCRPETPYATAKLAAHQLTGQFRVHDSLFACSGILYNHESERRPEHFVSRKITRAAAAIKLGHADHVVLGDLSAVRDWSFAGDVMEGAWLILQHDEPDDYVLASGVGHTVAELADAAFAHVGLEAKDHVRVDPALVRPPETVPPVGDAGRARDRLGWRPALDFEQLIHRMVDADLRALQAKDGLL
jgi:GDPmannose 4,6-dehydratase